MVLRADIIALIEENTVLKDETKFLRGAVGQLGEGLEKL